MRSMNIMLMAKLGWRLCSEKDSLWTQILASKYTRGNASPKGLMNKHSSSNSCKGTVEGATIVQVELRAKVYNGVNTLFWREGWIGNAQIIEQTPTTLPLAESFRTVKDY